jgi:hypothetical protein
MFILLVALKLTRLKFTLVIIHTDIFHLLDSGLLSKTLCSLHYHSLMLLAYLLVPVYCRGPDTSSIKYKQILRTSVSAQNKFLMEYCIDNKVI